MKGSMGLKRWVTVFLAMMLIMTAAACALGESFVADRVSDPSTMDIWEDYFGSGVNSTLNAGGVFMDKSVFEPGSAGIPTSITDTKDNFLVALSAIAANKSIEDYDYIPTDTVLILDMSSSMSSDIAELAAATNTAIKELLELNPYNRVSVVIYSGNTQDSLSLSAAGATTVLMPLARYNAGNGGNYVNVTNRNRSIEVTNGVTRADNGSYYTDARPYRTGTFIQDGIYEGMLQLLQADTTIAGTGLQSGTTRLPIFVLMTDGNPTLGTLNYTGSSNTNLTYSLAAGGSAAVPNTLGNNNRNLNNEGEVMAFLTQLTATYAKEKVEEHYGRTPLFYTLGFNITRGTTAYSVMNPTVNTGNLNTYWNRLANTANGNSFTVDGFTIRRNADATNRDYVDQYFAATSNNLTTAFESIVERIILQSLYYPTFSQAGALDTSGYIEFIDDIGEYMEVRDIIGIQIGDQLYTGQQFASHLVTGGDLGTVENPTALGDQFIWSVQERLGIDDVEAARELVSRAWNSGQLAYSTSGGTVSYSNYIGWYSNASGKYIAHGERGDLSHPSGAVYYNESYGMLGQAGDTDMMYISIRIEKNLATGEERVIWKIPATLIPMVSYEIVLDDPGDALDQSDPVESVTVTSEEPISLLYEVGPIAGLTPFNLESTLSAEYKAAHSYVDQNGNKGYYLYANEWDESQLNHNHPSEAVNAVAWFEPSLENERYYYTENSTIYTDTNGTVYTGGRPSGSGYYYRHVIFERSGGSWKVVERYEPISANAITAAQQGTGNSWYIPKGTMRRPLSTAHVQKANNPTDTIDYAAYLAIEASGSDYYSDSVLGNNGRLAVLPAQGLRLQKTMDGTDTGASFMFVIEGVQSGAYQALHTAADGAQRETTVTFANGMATVYLKHGETLDIIGMPTGSYTVTEVTDTHYEVKTIRVNNVSQTVTTQSADMNGTVRNQTGINVSVRPSEMTAVHYTNAIVVANDLIIHKVLAANSAAVPESYDPDFSMLVTLAPPSNVALASSYQTSAGTVSVANNQFTVGLKLGESLTVYDLPVGTQVWAQETASLPAGFSHVSTAWKGGNTIATDSIQEVTVTNRYAPNPVTKPIDAQVEITKKLTGRPWLTGDSFTFVLEHYDQAAAAWTQLSTHTVYDNGMNADHTFDTFSQFLRDEDFTAAGNYWYRVSESIPQNALGGMTYEPSVALFVVTVTDQNGQLVITNVGGYELASVTQNTSGSAASWDIAATFENKYAIDPLSEAEVTINVVKQIVNASGQVLSGQVPVGYQFQLYQVIRGDAAGPAYNLVQTSAATGVDGKTSIFIDYLDDVGVYEFVLREVIPQDAATANPNITYYTQDIPLWIAIVDNYDGTVSGVVYLDNPATTQSPRILASDLSIAVQNIYTPDPSGLTNVTLVAAKRISGRSWQVGDTFSFILERDNSVLPGGWQQVGEAQTVTFEGGSGDVRAAVFTALQSETYSAPGTYAYRVREVIPQDSAKLGGITYSDAVLTFSVTVAADSNTGTLHVQNVQGGNGVTITPDDAANPTSWAIIAEFTNPYAVPGNEVAQATLEIVKRVVDQDTGTVLTGAPLAGYEFELYDSSNRRVARGTTDADGKTTLTVAGLTQGLYEYTLKEVAAGAQNITYAQDIPVMVQVVDALDGTLDALVYLKEGNAAGAPIGSTATLGVTVDNKHNPSPITASNLNLTVSKKLTGRAWQSTDSFVFLLEKLATNANGAASWVEVGRQTFTGNNGADGASYDVAFDQLMLENYTATGTYTYRVTEVIPTAGALGGVMYSTQISIFDVYVGKEFVTGDLVIERVENRQNTTVTPVTDANGVTTWGIAAAFENIYSVGDNAQAELIINKQLVDTETGLVRTDLPLNGYQFQLYDASGTKIGNVLTTDAAGTVAVTIGGLTKASIGQHELVLQELPGNAPGVTYHKDNINLVLTVSDNTDGTISATLHEVNAAAPASNPYTITVSNAFTEPTGDLVLHKTFLGAVPAGYPQNQQFTFEVTLTPPAGKTLEASYETEHREPDGSVTAGSVTLTDNKFTVLIGADDEIKVKGLLDGTRASVSETNIPTGFKWENGVQNATVSMNSGVMVSLYNSYTPVEVKPTNVTLAGTKEIVGRDWLSSDRFAFVLERANGTDQQGNTIWQTMDRTLYATAASKRFDFSTLLQAQHYETAGTYTYQVRELPGTIGGMTYASPAQFSIRVEDVNGQLTVVEVLGIANAAVAGDRASGFAIEVSFKNTYAPNQTASAEVSVLKKIVDAQTGAALTQQPLNGFEFALFDANGAKVGTSAVTDIDGKAVVTLSIPEQTAAGKYQYELREVNGGKPGMSYAEPLMIAVEVIDNQDGTLSAVIWQGKATDVKPSTAGSEVTVEMVNRYTQNEVAAAINVLKTVRNIGTVTRDPSGFTFVLTDASGNAYTAVSDSQGKAVFSLSFKEEDAGKQFAYTLTEKNTGEADMQYSTASYKVTVEIVRGAGNALAAQITSDGKAMNGVPFEFENIYGSEEVLEDIPQTGDESNLMLWALMLAAAGVGLFTLNAYRRRSSNG